MRTVVREFINTNEDDFITQVLVVYKLFTVTSLQVMKEKLLYL